MVTQSENGVTLRPLLSKSFCSQTEETEGLASGQIHASATVGPIPGGLLDSKHVICFHIALADDLILPAVTHLLSI